MKGIGNSEGSRGNLSAVDRLGDAQLAAVQARVFLGWNTRRIAERLGVARETVELWFRDPVTIAAGLELQRAFLAAEILPLGLHRLRRELASPVTKAADVVRIVRLAADLAGMPGGVGAHGPGIFGGENSAGGGAAGGTRPLDECSADELRQIADQGRAALDRLARKAKPADPGRFAPDFDVLDG